MKKVGFVALLALLVVPLLAVPAEARWSRHGHGGGGFFLGVGLGALLTAPWWYHPAYAYPPAYYYPYPVYPSYPVYAPGYPAPPAYTPPSAMTPTPQPLSPPPQGGAEAAPPSQPEGLPAAPQASQNCQTVWVDGHYETRISAGSQRVTVWVPAHTEQICQ